MLTRAEAQEAAATLRKLLELVQAGEIDASKMEANLIAGSALTLEQIAKPTTRPRRTL